LSEGANVSHTPKLIIISAPSGAGKSTLCNQLLKDFEKRLVLSVSCTTRTPRPGDLHGREYYFISAEEFQKKIQANAFAEWAQVHGNYYGTLKSTIADCWAKGQSVLLEIDVQGAANLRKTYPARCFSVFVTTPNMEELEKRLRGRGTDSEETIQRRLKNAREEMTRVSEFDHVLVNDEFKGAYGQLKKWVEAHV
jgi:guanylate kinase